MAAPVAAGVSFTNAQIRNKQADGPLTSLVPSAAAQAGKGMLPASSHLQFSRRTPLRPPENRRNTNFLITTQQYQILAQK